MEELIIKLYNIVLANDINLFKENIDDFYCFYMSLNSFWKLDDKKYAIIKFLLDKNDYFNEFFNNDYVLSGILDFLNRYQKRIAFDILSNEKSSVESLDILFLEYDRYLEISNILLGDNFKINNNINKNSYLTYLNKEMYVYLSDAFSLILKNGFLELDNDDLFKIMDIIDKINEHCFKDNSKSMLIRDLFIKYIKRIIPIKYFVSDDTIEDDKIVNLIISGKCQDEKLIKQLFETLSPEDILNLFKSVDNVFEFISKLSYDDYIKYKLYKLIMDKFLNEDYFMDLLFIFEIKLDDITEKIKTDYENKLILFCNNCGLEDKSKYELMKKLRLIYNDEIDNNFNELTGDNNEMDYYEAISQLNQYFKDEIILDKDKLKLIIRAIVKYYLGEKGIDDFSVLFVSSNLFNGEQNFKKRIIKINNILLSALLNDKLELQKRLKIFETLFHEMQHAIQYNNIVNNRFDLKNYFIIKELILMFYDVNFYSQNYKSVIEEIDARDSGFHNSITFLKQFEGLKGKIDFNYANDYSIKDYFNKKVFDVTVKPEYFDILFDRLILLHPNLIKQYPILKLEYNDDGIRHSIIDSDGIKYEFNGNYIINDVSEKKI